MTYFEIYRSMGYSKESAAKMAAETSARLDGISGKEKMRILMTGE